MTSFKQKMLFVGICLLFTVFQSVVGLAVMSVDIGSEWMKVAIVSPGVPMEVVLNRESQRKTPVAVAFRDGERVFGDPALSIGVRFPDKCFMYLMDIIGKQIDNPLVELYQKRFPYYKMDATEDRKSIKFTHPEGMEFTVEELIAMILKQAQQIAEKHAGQPIKDAVITVPAFFNQAERRAMLQAAKLSGLNVLQLINSNTAVALNYGVFRRKDFNETPTNILFYDMGAGSTVATVVSYQLVKSKETGEVSPQLSVKGVGFDHTLGGLEMQLRLRDTFASAFNKEKKTSNDVLKNNRAMAKLFKEAGRVKKVLSANTEHVAQVESLLDDKDFRFPISRAEFEELLKDLFVRVTEPVETALKSAYIDMNLIDQVILSGSGARVPMVQQILLDFIKKELGKSLNTDESAALGAAYQAAHLSKGFKVKTFLVKDANIFPIQVDFQREYELEDKTTGIKTVKRILFSRNNGIPMKKIMTFNRHVKDFEFYVNYGDDLKTFLNDFQLRALGSPNISKVSLSGVEATIGKHMGEKTEYKGVKAHFRVDESGILNLDEVESVFEKTEEETAESKLESAFNKLGSTLGRLFSGSSEEETKGEKPEESNDSKTDESKDSKKEDEKAQNVTKEGEKNATEPKKQMKLVTIKEPLVSAQEYLDLPNLSDGSIKESVKKLKDLDEHDRARLAKAKAKNSLESFIVDTKDKLNRDEYIKASTDDERNSMLQKLNEAGDWLEYESDDATTTDVYKGKLKELSTLTQSLFERVQEHIHRPDAVKTLNEMINISQVFLASARNMSEDEQIFTEVELQTLETLITETNKWLEESVAEQNTLSLSVTPKLTMKMLGEKIMALDREVKYLLNKKRFAQPLKKKPAKKETVNETEQNTTEQEKVATESTTGETESSNDQEVKPLDVPDLENSNTEEATTVKDSINPSPSPDTVKEDDHSEL